MMKKAPKHLPYTDIDRAYTDVRAIRAKGHGAALTVYGSIITVTTRAPKKILRRL